MQESNKASIKLSPLLKMEEDLLSVYSSPNMVHSMLKADAIYTLNGRVTFKTEKL